ncbi:MAG: PEP-CTERM sorting domain-containing protein [Verrucomicrobiota bacterium]|nr:PEP-CTERM sorting domain-containing protein [Limisphaera sp.]MDW8381828.1 PEP-CTERM sorting domain-containing protein [Verrucomicrobiota bacterium]
MMQQRLGISLICSALLTAASTARAVLLAYEGFDYTPGQSLVGQSGGFGFSTAWLGDANAVANSAIVAGSFSYTDAFGNVLVTSGHRVWVTGDGRPEGDNFPGGVNGNAAPRRNLDFYRGLDSSPTTTWASVLALRVGPPYTYNAPDGKTSYYGRGVGALQFFYNATPGSTAQGNEHLSFGRGSENTTGIDPNRNVDTWAVLNRGAAAQQVTSTVLMTNQPPTFMVIRIDHSPGIGPHTNAAQADKVYVWLNPANLTVEPDINSANMTLTPIQFQASNDRDYVFNIIRLFGGNFNATVGYSSIQVDEIRIGTEYWDVAPIPEPGLPALLGLGGLAAIWLCWRRRV